MATSTDVPIYTATLGAVSSVTIPLSDYQMYANLKLVVTAQRGITGSGGGGLNITLNGDSGNNYATTLVYEAPNSLHDTNGPRFVYMGGVGDGHMMLSTISFMDYSNTNKFKSVIGRWGSSTSGEVRMGVGTWLNTAAITSITMAPPNGFAAGSTISVYGVGTASPAKATGGAIYSDSDYWYHVFTSSGTFTPSQTLSCDYLVIAGGGGGGATSGGGGGAGGLRSTVTATGGGGTLESPLSLSATSYTVTIGAGGSGGAGGANAGNSGSAGNNSVFASITATGGGAGSGNTKAPTSGGSGGGAAAEYSGGPGSGTSGQGFAGGNRYSAGSANGGGGGAGAVGVTPTTAASGAGGAGVAIPVFATVTGTGVNNYYAGGGGGGARTIDGQPNPGAGGAGGGGAGKAGNAVTGGAGIANTGGGGGGSDYFNPTESTQGAGGAGGSGLVVIRYAK